MARIYTMCFVYNMCIGCKMNMKHNVIPKMHRLSLLDIYILWSSLDFFLNRYREVLSPTWGWSGRRRWRLNWLQIHMKLCHRIKDNNYMVVKNYGSQKYKKTRSNKGNWIVRTTRSVRRDWMSFSKSILLNSNVIFL